MNELTTKREWKKYIQEAHGGTKEAMLEEAKRLYEYQQHCASKKGGSEFAETVGEWCGYGASVARQMAQVGGDHLLRNNVTKLPESWGTCYEITTLPEDKRKSLPLSPSLTRAQVKNWKAYGTLESPEILDVEEDELEATTELEEAAMLIPPLETWGLTVLGKRAMEQDRKKIQEMIQNIARTQSRKFIDSLIEVFKYHQGVLKQEIRRQIPDTITAMKSQLDERERKLDLREKAIVGGISEKDRKLILSVLHPDRAPADMRGKYVKAFQAFKEVAG